MFDLAARSPSHTYRIMMFLMAYFLLRKKVTPKVTPTIAALGFWESNRRAVCSSESQFPRGVGGC